MHKWWVFEDIPGLLFIDNETVHGVLYAGANSLAGGWKKDILIILIFICIESNLLAQRNMLKIL